MAIIKTITTEIPEIKEETILLNRFYLHLEEINKVVGMLNDKAKKNKLVIEIKIETKK